MEKKLYRVYLTRFQGFHESGVGNFCSTNVMNLGEDVFFETVGTSGNVYWTVFLNQATEIPVYCYEENLSMSHEELQRSMWTYDKEKNHVLLYVKVVIPPSEPHPVEEEIELAPPTEPPTEEEFQEYLKSLRPYSRSMIQRVRDLMGTDEDKRHIQRESRFKKSLGGLPEDEQNRRKRLIDNILYRNNELPMLGNAKIQSDEEDETRTNKYVRKRLSFGLCVLLMLACLLAFLFFGVNFRDNGTAKVTTTVTPSQSPSRQGILPTLNPVSSPISRPTEDNFISSPPTDSPTMSPINDLSSQSPTESTTLLPSLKPTFLPSIISTKKPTSMIISAPTFSPSQSPTISPILQPTDNPTFYPSINPTTQLTDLATSSPTFSPSVHPSVSSTLRPTIAPSKIAILPPVILPSASPTFAPSHLPTTGATTQFPTVTETNLPSVSPTKPPTLQTKSRLNCNEIRETKAATQGNFGDNNFKIEIIDGKSYCGDTYGGTDPERPKRNKWSVRSGRRDCPTFSYEDGSDICDTVGARWCSLEELELLVGKGTGCGADKLLVYSTTDCVSETGIKGKMKYAPGDQAVRFPNYECEPDLSKETPVRCCGDF